MEDFIEVAIREAGLTMTSQLLESGRHLCTLVGRDAQLQRELTMEEDVTEAPNIGQVLYFLAVNAQLASECEDLEDWAEEMDLDPTQEATQAAYAKAVKEAEELEAVLGRSAYGAMLGGLAISQAIGMARFD